MMKILTRGMLAAMSAGAVVMGLATVGAPTAQSATFVVNNNPPTVGTVTCTSPISPTGTAQCSAAVTDLNRIRTLDTVTLEIFGAGGIAGSITQFNSYKMVTTHTGAGNGSWSAPVMSANGNAAFTNNASVFPVAAQNNAKTATFTFKFNVPKVMRQASNWQGKITAVDGNAASGSNQTAANLVVNSYQEVAALSNVAFGTIPAEDKGAVPVSNSTLLITNHVSDVNYTAGLTWTGNDVGATTVDVTTAAGIPTEGLIKINCAQGAAPVGVDQGIPLVGGASTTVIPGSPADTSETGTTPTTGCNLWQGGTAPGTYTGALTIAAT